MSNARSLCLGCAYSSTPSHLRKRQYVQRQRLAMGISPSDVMTIASEDSRVNVCIDVAPKGLRADRPALRTAT